MTKTSFSKSIFAGSKILIRFDDIAPNMNWDMMNKCQNLLDYYNIKPVMGIIPHNKDKDLLKYPLNKNFWNLVHKWVSKGWDVAMHGYNHKYDKDTKKKDFFKLGGRSEFFGHSYEEQLKKIQYGLKIFKKNKLNINTFFAPNHTYDLNTFKALQNSGIKQIIDGYGISTFKIGDLIFIPQLFYKFYTLPIGLQSTQIHINEWNEKNLNHFEIFIKKNKKKIINLNTALLFKENNFMIKIINKLIEYSLRTKRSLN